jgi:hypothetical protein
MTKQKFTPGPWELSEPYYADMNHMRQSRQITNGEFQVARLYVEGGNSEVTEELEANARLISAAPDLVEACQNLIKIIRENIEDFPDSVIDAEEALRKAGIQ